MSHSCYSSAASTSGSSPQITPSLQHLSSPAEPPTGRSRTTSSDSTDSADSLDTAYEEALSFFQSVADEALAESVAMGSSSPSGGRQSSQQSWASSAASPASSHARRSSASSGWTVDSVGTALTDFDSSEGEGHKRVPSTSSDIRWGSPELLRTLDSNPSRKGFSHNPTPPRQSATTPTAATFNFPPPPTPATLPAPPHHRLASSTSNATIRAQSGKDRVPKPSFTSTPVGELDIDAILEAYAASWEDELAQQTIDNSSSESLGTVAAIALPDTAFPAPPFRLRSAPSTRSLVARSPITPSRISPSSSAVAYPNVFPSIKRAPSGPFPTRQKSTTSLRSQNTAPQQLSSSIGFPFPPPPIPAGYLDGASVMGSPKPSMSPRGSVASIGSRSSYASTSHGSFRWSVNTASTAPTMADDDWVSKRGSRSGSSVRSSVASSAFVGSPSARHSAASARTGDYDGGDCDWLTFARELDATPPPHPSTFSSRRPSLAPTDEGSEADLDGTALSRREMKALRKSASSKSALSLHAAPSSASLGRKMSGVSLRHLGRTATVARPPIPHRSASLKASLAEKAARQEAGRIGA